MLNGLEDAPAALAPLVHLHLQLGKPVLAEALLERRADGRGRPAALRGDRGTGGRRPRRCSGAAERGCESWRSWSTARIWMPMRRCSRVGSPPRERQRRTARELENAIARFAALGFPLEEARARLALAGVQADVGSPLASPPRGRARDAFERLGARRDADQAAALLRELGVAGPNRGPGRARRADGARARGARAGRRRPLERRDRRAARDRAKDGRAPRQPRARQARRAQPGRGGGARGARGALADRRFR